MIHQDNNDITSVVGDNMLNYKLNENYKMSSHSWRTVVGLALVFIVGGLQALNGVGGLSAWIAVVIPVLLFAEHFFAGNTGSTS